METVNPESVGLSSAGLERLSRSMQAYIDRREVPGAVTLVARRGRVAHLGCFGMADVEAGHPMRPDTIFRLASITKVVTSVGAMMLHEEGRFELSDPISRFVPALKDVQVFVRATDAGFELARPEREITIQHLLTHTSGLASGDPDGSPLEVMIWESDQQTARTHPNETLAQWVQRLAGFPLAFQPGSKWEYGPSMTVLGHLIEVISGQTLDAFLEQRVFAPLGMVDTGFYVPQEKLGRLAKLYWLPENGEFREVDPSEWRDFTRQPTFLSGGGGLVSTAPDFYRLAQLLLNGGELDGVRLLNPETVRLMTTNHLPDALLPMQLGPMTYIPGMGCGLGVFVVTDVTQVNNLGSNGRFTHAGATGTFFCVDPKEELIGIALPQIWFRHNPPIVLEFIQRMFQAELD